MKLLIVEDQPVMVLGYHQIFAKNDDVLLYDARTISEARVMVTELRPDVIVINANLPDGSGFDFIRRLTRQKPKLKAIIFSMTSDPAVVMRAIDCGAMGFLSKSADAIEVREAIKTVSNGKTWIGEDLIQQVAFTRVVRSEYQPRFTRREKNVLNLLLDGCNSSQIASELNISSILVTTDCAAMRRKLNARTTAEMLAIAARSDLGR